MTTLNYTQELMTDIFDSNLEYYQTGFTVCGAEDPAVVYLGEAFKKKYPALKDYTVVRIVDTFISAWVSKTTIKFSNKKITKAEYKLYEKIVDAK